MLSSCSTQKLGRLVLQSIKPAYTFCSDSLPPAPDYSHKVDWFLFQDQKGMDIDVFYIHPTTYLSKENWNQPLTDSINVAKTKRKAIKAQAMMFDSIANIYAPMYRHATFYSFVDKDSNGVQALDLAYNDVKASFLYYLENENNGKPLMLAGHSQGSFLAMRLLQEKEIQEKIGDKLIVAYLIGWPFSENDISETPYVFCQDATDYNCIASWNAQKANSPVSMKSYKEGEEVYSINPLGWTTSEEYFDKSHNIGGLFLKGDSLIYRENYIGARNYKGILAVDKPKDKKELGIPKNRSNYHVQDIMFFYGNMKLNAVQRKRVFLSKSGIY